MVGKLVDFLKILHRRVIFSSLLSASVSTPMMPFIGVRISCDMRERNVVFDWLASSAASGALHSLYAALHFSRFVKSEKVVFFCAALHNVHSDPLAVLHAEFCGQMISQKLFPSVSKSFVNIFMRHSPFFLCCKLPPQRATYSPPNRSTALHREPNANKVGP